MGLFRNYAGDDTYLVPRHNRKSILDFAVGGVKCYSRLISDMKPEQIASLPTVLASDSIAMAWLKDGKVTVFTHNGKPRTWMDIIASLSIEVDVCTMLMKRLSRAFAFRDVVVRAHDVRIGVVDHDEFTEYNTDELAEAVAWRDGTAESAAEQLLDGPVAISRSFARKMVLKAGNVSLRRLNRAEGLSISIITPDGMIKALAYVVDDDKMPLENCDIITSAANIKSQIRTTQENLFYVAFDLAMPFGSVKTNRQLEVNMGRSLFSIHNHVNNLVDVLAKSKNAIINGEILPKWVTPMTNVDRLELDDNFGFLNHMMLDIQARGMDYRHFPALVGMAATSESMQWWDEKRNWYKFPLPCWKFAPVISVSMSYLIGEDMDVNRGEIRAIRGGDVWVVNDLDFVDFFTENAGGADGDDHYPLFFCTINGVRKVMPVRIPNGWGEYNIFNFVDGDPYPMYTNVDGVEISFPEIPGKLKEQLVDGLKAGTRSYFGLPEAESVNIGDVWGPDALVALINDSCSSDGSVGGVILKVMLAAGVDPALLANMPCSVESIVDTFTKDGAAGTKDFLQRWADQLVVDMCHSTTPVDEKLWNAMAGKLPESLDPPPFKQGMFSTLDAANKMLRQGYTNEMNQFASDVAQTANPTLDAALAIFKLNRGQVENSQRPVFIKAKQIHRTYNRKMSELLNDPTRERDAKIKWSVLYEWVADEIFTQCNGDEMQMMDLTLAVWVRAMCVPTSGGRINDRLVVNYKSWKLLVKALSYYGICTHMVKGQHVVMHRVVNSWKLTCKVCGKEATRTDPAMVMMHHELNSTCSACRGNH